LRKTTKLKKPLDPGRQNFKGGNMNEAKPGRPKGRKNGDPKTMLAWRVSPEAKENIIKLASELNERPSKVLDRLMREAK